MNSLKSFKKECGGVLLISTIGLAACSSAPVEQRAVQGAEEAPVLYSEAVKRQPELDVLAASRNDYIQSAANTAEIPAADSDRLTSLDQPLHNDQVELSFSKALSQVWFQHPNIVRAISEVEATGFDIKGARSGFYPYLRITAVEASNNDSNTTVNVIQPLWSGGSTIAEVKKAKAEQIMALAGLNQARLDLAVQASEAYLNVMMGQDQSGLWQEYINNLENLLRIIKRRAETGVSPDVDIQTVQTRLSQARAGFASTKAQLLASKLQLEALLHRPARGLAWPDNSYQLSETEIGRILGDGAIEAHPVGQQAMAEIAIQQATVKLAKASVFPTLSLQHSARVEQSSGDFTPDSSTQFVLNYQTNDGLKGFRGFQAVQHRLRAAEQNLLFARRDVHNLIYSANAERVAAMSQYGAQLRAAEAAARLVDSFLRQFKVGRKAWLEVLNAHREAHETRLQASVTKRNYWVANARMALQGMVWSRLSDDAPQTWLDFSRDNQQQINAVLHRSEG